MKGAYRPRALSLVRFKDGDGEAVEGLARGRGEGGVVGGVAVVGRDDLSRAAVDGGGEVLAVGAEGGAFGAAAMCWK